MGKGYTTEELCKLRFLGNLDKDIALMQDILSDDDTIIFRRFENRHDRKVRGCIIFTEVLVNNLIIDQNVVRPLMGVAPQGIALGENLAEEFAKAVINTDDIKTKVRPIDAVNSILIGDTVVLLDSCESAVIANSKKYNIRSISVPETENSVNGPKEGFTELIVANIGLIRRKVRNPNLKFRFFELGRVSKTRVCLTYIDGIADDKVIDELILRLSSFEIDSVLDISYVEELVSDSPTSPFATVGKTERPDVVAARLFEGRVALLCDGTPFVLTAPFLFAENFQANEDYYVSYYFATFTRALRFIAFFIAVSLPAIYVALISYHKELIPLKLLQSIASSRASVPFPAVVEMLLLLLLFDLLREGGLRLPKGIGVTVSTVGAIVLGQSIVEANIVSAEMIIIVAVCGIASFLIPKLETEIILLRLGLLVLSATLGIYGYAIGIVIFTSHISSLMSFGVEFTAYLMPSSREGAKDIYVRAPWWKMKKRPYAIQRRNSIRFRRR